MKKMYKKPETEKMVLPKEVLMTAIDAGLAGSPTGPGVGGGSQTAPGRRPDITV